MNLTGNWNGQYSYGKGYPKNIIGKSEAFEFDIKDSDEIFTGTCIDQIVKTKPGNEPKIEGVFKDLRYLRYAWRLRHAKLSCCLRATCMSLLVKCDKCPIALPQYKRAWQQQLNSSSTAKYKIIAQRFFFNLKSSVQGNSAAISSTGASKIKLPRSLAT